VTTECVGLVGRLEGDAIGRSGGIRYAEEEDDAAFGILGGDGAMARLAASSVEVIEDGATEELLPLLMAEYGSGKPFLPGGWLGLKLSIGIACESPVPVDFTGGTAGVQCELDTSLAGRVLGGLGFSINLISAELSDELLSSLVIVTETSTSGLSIRPSLLSRACSQSAFRRLVPATISSHTAVTYLGVAPRRMSASGLKPSYRRFRMMSMYCWASSGEMSEKVIGCCLYERVNPPDGADSTGPGEARAGAESLSSVFSAAIRVDGLPERYDMTLDLRGPIGGRRSLCDDLTGEGDLLRFGNESLCVSEESRRLGEDPLLRLLSRASGSTTFTSSSLSLISPSSFSSAFADVISTFAIGSTNAVEADPFLVSASVEARFAL